MIWTAYLGLHMAMSALDGMMARLPAKRYLYFGESKCLRVILHSALALMYLTSRDRVKLLSVQHFWLSEEPEVVGSIGWDAVST